MRTQQQPWPPEEYHSDCRWSSLKVDASGWSTAKIGTFEELGKYLQQPSSAEHEIAIPVLPTVYQPALCDKLYYDAIWQSDIQHDDKVLVIGTGSGADAWMASLKTRQPIHVVELNPMAVVNAQATAQLAGFEILPIVGDVTQVALPEGFREFDYVLWNMPFLHSYTGRKQFGEHRFHDGDDGTMLRAFLKMLPALLKADGKAILLNYATAAEFINGTGVEQVLDPESPEHVEGPIMLFIVSDASAIGLP